MHSPEMILALDFGGTKLSASLVNSENLKQWLRKARVSATSDARSNIEAMCRLARQALGGRIPNAIGVSFGGPVDFSARRVLLSHHVPGWENFPLGDVLQAEFHAPVIIENDANAAALGEWRFGAGKGCSSLLYVTVSTGVGGGWVLDGKIFRGANGLAGEIGHMVIQPEGPVCSCGKRGCVEALASGLSIARDAREMLAVEPHEGMPLRQLTPDPSALTAEAVSRAAQAGDQLAQKVLQKAASALGCGIGAALALINPQRVVIGGGVSKSGEVYWRALQDTVHTLVLPGVRVDLVPAALSDDAPLWGAAALALNLSGSV